MPNISIWEILLLLLVLLLVFGPKRLPEMGRSLGRGMREFKDSITGKHKEEEEEPEEQPAMVTASAEPAATPPAPATTTETKQASS
jgi:sec-independent protein translocase protein TatA